jgi:hypothetical protein
LRAKKSYPKMLLALGKIATPYCLVTATNPFKQAAGGSASLEMSGCQRRLGGLREVP